jgi:hypothetical protein
MEKMQAAKTKPNARKNPFMRRTKLSIQEFQGVIGSFCIGLSATEARATLAQINFPVSRQTIERMYLLIGDFIYRKYFLPWFFRQLRRDLAELGKTLDSNLEKHGQTLILDEIWKSLQGELNYAQFRANNWAYPVEQLMPYLRERWTKFNGFSRKNLVSHVGYATFRSTFGGQDAKKSIDHVLLEMCRDPL